MSKVRRVAQNERTPLVVKSKLSLGLWGETPVLRGHVTSSLVRKLTKTHNAAFCW